MARNSEIYFADAIYIGFTFKPQTITFKRLYSIVATTEDISKVTHSLLLSEALHSLSFLNLVWHHQDSSQ